MPDRGAEIHDDEYDALKDAIADIGRNGPFTVSEILMPALREGVTVKVTDIEPMLEYLVEMGHLFRLDCDPPRWKWAFGPP
jgi:hypothetical protein